MPGGGAPLPRPRLPSRNLQRCAAVPRLAPDQRGRPRPQCLPRGAGQVPVGGPGPKPRLPPRLPGKLRHGRDLPRRDGVRPRPRPRLLRSGQSKHNRSLSPFVDLNLNLSTADIRNSTFVTNAIFGFDWCSRACARSSPAPVRTTGWWAGAAGPGRTAPVGQTGNPPASAASPVSVRNNQIGLLCNIVG